MKLISVDTARTSWLFPLSELNPTGRSLTNVFLGLAERYSFKKFPNHTLDAAGEDKAITFEEGEFANRAGAKVIVKLRVYSDGCVADCWSSTKDAEDFLKDVMAWLRTEHGLALPADRVIRSLYFSELTVTTNKNLVTLSLKLRDFAEELSAKVKEFSGYDMGFNVGSIGFWPNDPKNRLAPGTFRFENKAGTLPKEKRYYSQAPLPTEEHLAVIDKFEAILD